MKIDWKFSLLCQFKEVLNIISQFIVAENNLQGTIPNHIGNMTSIEALFIREYFIISNDFVFRVILTLRFFSFLFFSPEQNNLGGSIPNQIGSLHSLKKLNLGTLMMKIFEKVDKWSFTSNLLST